MPRSGYVADLRQQVGHRLLTVPAVTAAVFDDHDRLLMLQDSDGDRWAPPGGTIEPGETPANAMVREMWEETRLVVLPVAVIGVFGGPDFDVRYDNGDVTTYVMTVFDCRIEEGDFELDPSEVTAHAYFDPQAANEAHRRRQPTGPVSGSVASRDGLVWEPSRGRQRPSRYDQLQQPGADLCTALPLPRV